MMGFDANLLGWILCAPLGIAFAIAFLRWLITPPTWRDFEGPMIDEGERFATDPKWWRWWIDVLLLRWWRW